MAEQPPRVPTSTSAASKMLGELQRFCELPARLWRESWHHRITPERVVIRPLNRNGQWPAYAAEVRKLTCAATQATCSLGARPRRSAE